MEGAAILDRLNTRARIEWQVATVREVFQDASHVRTLVLDVPSWPGHRAGQHVDVRLTADDGYQAERSYSIASPPELDGIQISVELIEDGEVSPYLVDVVGPRDAFEIRGPIGGHFSWSVAEGGPLLLVAGGSGLVPLMAMLRHRAAHGSDVEVHTLISARSPEEALYREEIETLGPRDGLHIARTYTRSAPQGWQGWTRRVDAEMLAAVAPPPDSGARSFVCGPTPFVEAVATLLVEIGHDPGSIHAERFGPTGG